MDAHTVVIVTIVVALAFDVINGFHDAANSIATVVSTRVLSPRTAVLWAACFNFVALWLFGEGVAKTVSGIIKIDAGDHAFVWVVLTGLLGAIVWNLMTWWWGLPSSSSHALMGGLGGAGVAHAGLGVLVQEKVRMTVAFIFLSPLIGFILGGLLMVIVTWIVRRWRPTKVDRTFRVLQLVSSGAYSIGHGGNDAQKTMGIIMAVMIADGMLQKGSSAPAWVPVASYACMALGTAMGGWRIVKTMGSKLTHLKPIGGFAAEIAGFFTLAGTAFFHVPVSTTHTITGAIVGVGSTNRARGVRWGLASRIVWAWVFTIPASAGVGAGCYWIVEQLGLW